MMRKKKVAPLFSTSTEFHNGKKIVGIVTQPDNGCCFKVSLIVSGKQTSFGVWSDYGHACNNAQAWVDKYIATNGQLK
jgi:hypothetical protein